VRHVLRTFADNDGRRVKSIRLRFADPVFPGDTLETRMWQVTPTRIAFAARVVERDRFVVRNGVLELHPPPSSAAP
jgi:3-hydroxyacyl-CoA dehydrogenase/3a,7a,12a-trihydroxy-5b-cholest-24-enoyl-CoA hydratase